MRQTQGVTKQIKAKATFLSIWISFLTLCITVMTKLSREQVQPKDEFVPSSGDFQHIL